VTTTYLYDGLLPVLERQGSSTTVNVWGLSLGGGIGGLLARVTPAGSFYPLYDGSGNILAWTDSTGAVVSTATYTAFGEGVSRSGSDPGGSDPFGFSTKASSAATGLSYFGARYYSASLARWLTPDPLGMVDGPNVYQYVWNNPVNHLDPCGFSTEPGVVDETDVMLDIFITTTTVVICFLDTPAPGPADLAGIAVGQAIRKGVRTSAAREAAEIGRRAHKEFARRVRAKQAQGWRPEPTIKKPGGKTLRPDAISPSGRPVELKPDTPTGRARGSRQIKKYEEILGKKGRVVYYDPPDFL
jgi:RHS repeat-associated protein